jgi:hypothetical protein
MAEGVETLWYDAWLHGDDVLAALGRSAPRDGGLVVSVLHLTDSLRNRGWGPAVVALDGLEEVRIGEGDGPRVTGDPLRFVYVATGRADPAELGLDEEVNVYR